MVPPTAWSGRQQEQEDAKKRWERNRKEGNHGVEGVKRAKGREGQERGDMGRDMGSRNRKTNERT